MRRRSASKGHSCTLGKRCCNAARSKRRAAAAAAIKAVSVGSPFQPSGCSGEVGAWPVSTALARASLHSATARHKAAPAVRLSPCSGSRRICTASTCMRLSVKVPVLSAHSTLTEPSVSTAGRRLTRALASAIRRAPSASSTATTAGSASGMAATASETAVISICRAGSPRINPTARISRQIPATAQDSRAPRWARRRCSGVCRRLGSASRWAIWPIWVAAPVATTRPCARP